MYGSLIRICQFNPSYQFVCYPSASGASAMVASEDTGAAGEGWGEDAELVIDEGN